MSQLGAQLLLVEPSSQSVLCSRMNRPIWELTDMEVDFDRRTAPAQPMTIFVLPGGMAALAHTHLDSSVCRRAEREVVALTHEEPMNPVDRST